MYLGIHYIAKSICPFLLTPIGTSDILFLINWVQCDVGPPFAALTVLTSLCTRFECVYGSF